MIASCEFKNSFSSLTGVVLATGACSVAAARATQQDLSLRRAQSRLRAELACIGARDGFVLLEAPWPVTNDMGAAMKPRDT